MKTYLNLFVSSLCLLPTVGSCESSTPSVAPSRTDITVDMNDTSYSIDPAFFGVCDMFWKESDDYMSDGVIEGYLKDMDCGFLRYPGGTESDNFIWETNLLEDKRRWPYEDGQDKMDTDEFIVLCRRVGAQPIICVNTEIAVLENDEDKAVKMAADWVRYCNIEKGYNVIYWEIGNEPYYHYRFTADEYAKLFKKMAAAMKKVDPSIKVAAVGEWNTEWVGHLDRIPAINRAKAREMEYSIEVGEGKYVESDLTAMQTVSDPQKWWDTLLKEAGDYIDVASIHWYFNESDLTGMTNSLDRLTDLFSSKLPGKEPELIMTEWSMYHTIQKFGMERALYVGEAIGRALDGNVKKSTYWPLRCAGDHDKKGLFMEEEKTPRANYWVYRMFATNVGEYRVRCAGYSLGTYNFATVSEDGKHVQLFVLNRSERAIEGTAGIKGVDKCTATECILSAGDDKNTDYPEYAEKKVEYGSEGVKVVLPPWSMAVYRFDL